MDRPASEISMAQLLGQLFQYTEVFDMQTRPELLLLQKTMVVVEGVGRSLDPELNMWVVSEPVVKEWMEQTFGAGAQFEAAAEGAASVGRFMGDIPKLLGQAERTAEALSSMAEEGLRLDDHTVERLAEAQGAREPPKPHRHLGRRAGARGHRPCAAVLNCRSLTPNASHGRACPGIQYHRFLLCVQDVDARHKAGHD